MAMERAKFVLEFNFASGATAANETHDISTVSSLAFVFPAEFDTDVITVTTDVPGDTGFTVTAATGRVALNSDQALSLFPMGKMRLSTNTATAAAATVYVLCGC
jgi:hypothetical protein